jgi:methyl-accepting chemotaxis protein
MTQVPNLNRRVPEATLQDAVDAIDRVESTISQLGVEVQRILTAMESIAKSLEQIADVANNR